MNPPISVTVGSYGLQTANIITEYVDHDSAPEATNTILPLARADRSVLVNRQRQRKTIGLKGHVSTSSRAALDALLDELRLQTDVRDGELFIDYGSSRRRYQVTTEAVAITRTAVTTADFTITFVLTNPFGHDLTLANPVNSYRNMVGSTSNFETNVTSWSAYNGAAISRDANVQLYGTASMRIVTTGTGANAVQGASYGLIPVVDGQSYTFSFWVKGTPGSIVRCYISGGSADSYTAYTLTGSWQRVTHTKSTYADTPSISVYVMVEGANTAARTVHVDGVQFEQGSTAAEYTESQVSDWTARWPIAVDSSYPVEPVVNMRFASIAGGTNKALSLTNITDQTYISITSNWTTSFALDFNGGGQVAYTSSPYFNMVDAVTISCWVNADASAGTLINKRFPSGNLRSFILEHNSGYVRFVVTNNKGVEVKAQDTFKSDMNIKAVRKAIAGALATIIVTWLARNDIIIDNTAIAGLIEYLLAAALGFLAVYAAPRNEDGPRL